jgi:hypothetical protein
MTVTPRADGGLFALKSESERLVRSVRATDWTWDEFGFLADQRRITRADLLEIWVKTPQSSPVVPTAIEKAIALEHLRQALELKANAGGAIKAAIRQALEILE